MRSHGDPTALNYTFYQILTAGDAQPKALRDIRFRYQILLVCILLEEDAVLISKYLFFFLNIHFILHVIT